MNLARCSSQGGRYANRFEGPRDEAFEACCGRCVPGGDELIGR